MALFKKKKQPEKDRTSEQIEPQMGLSGTDNADNMAINQGLEQGVKPNIPQSGFNPQMGQPVNDGQMAAELTPQTIFIPKIDENSLIEASRVLAEYKTGKANMEARIISNEKWWKLKQWDEIGSGSDNKEKPASAWLFNTVISKHADYDDAYPTFNCLPREQNDKEEATKLSSIIPVVLEQNRFRDTYSDCGWQKFKFGTAGYGIFWDNQKYNGLGDITIEKIDLLSLFWEPGITDIQKSRNVFRTQLMDNEVIEQIYPETKGKLGGSNAITVNKYVYDDDVRTDNKSLVVDWYYHTYANGKKILQYCRYVNTTILYSTENNPEMSQRGLYDHGLYPFVMDPLFPIEGSPCGYGYIDISKNPQMFIDRLGAAILDNAEWSARPRYFSRGDGAINEDEFKNPKNFLIRADSNLGDDSLKPIQTPPLSDINVAVRNNLIEEMKETTGNRDVNNGGSATGVTAASAIAAMQEQSGKTSRDSTQNSYRAYEKIINICIELIRQFYDVPRQFRITGEYGSEEYVSYSNQNLKPQAQGNAFGLDMGLRSPVFDLEVSSQKANAYTKISQNELALQFYQLGFFNPQNVDQALMTLDMMDFDQKQVIMNKLSAQGTMFQQLAQTQQLCIKLCQEIDAAKGTNMAEQFANYVMQTSGQQIPSTNTGASTEIAKTDNAGNLEDENKIVSDARAKAQAAGQPQ